MNIGRLYIPDGTPRGCTVYRLMVLLYEDRKQSSPLDEHQVYDTNNALSSPIHGIMLFIMQCTYTYLIHADSWYSCAASAVNDPPHGCRHQNLRGKIKLM